MSKLDLKPSEIVTEIIMSKQSSPWLAVEGESDERLLRERNYPIHPKIVIGHGWEGVRDIINDFQKESSGAKLIGLIDRDYRDHLGTQIENEILVLSDFRDIENMLFESSALDRVISEYGSKGKIPKNTQGRIDAKEIRDQVYSISVKLGKFRIFCQKKDLFLSLKEMNYKKFICDQTLEIDVKKFLAHLSGKNPGKKIPTPKEWSEAQKLIWPMEHLNQPRFVANGHDVMAILSIALRKIWGSNDHNIDAKFIEELFRIGYSNNELNTTTMWCKIVEHLNRQ